MQIKSVGQRLVWARNRKGWTAATLIEESGVPQGTVSKIERGEQKSLGNYGPQLAKAVGIDLNWLSTGKGKPMPFMPSDFIGDSIKESAEAGDRDVYVNQYRDVKWACGTGFVNSEAPEPDDRLSFKRSWLDKNNLNAISCITCPASGHSMSPTINHLDVVLINLEEKDITKKDGQIFAFSIGDECRIKRVFITLTGDVRLVSDNPNKIEYPDEIISNHEISNLFVAGRVRWSGGDK